MTFTRIAVAQSSAENSSKRLTRMTPAQFTSTSNWDSGALEQLEGGIDGCCVAHIGVDGRGLPPQARMVSATAWAASSRRSASHTRVPSEASCRAQAAPIPLPAPVTNAIRSLTSR